jgi:hypothetical protein
MDAAHASLAPPYDLSAADDATRSAAGGQHPADEGSSSFSDAERYAWIRGNRGNFLIFEALSRANFDKDFDTLIDAAMRNQRRGRHVPALPLANLPRRRRSDWE